MPSEEDDTPVDVYTDGSCLNSGEDGKTDRAGWAFVWPDSDEYDMGRVHGKQTSMRAEIIAAIKAIKKANQKGVKNLRVVTDSLNICLARKKRLKKKKNNKEIDYSTMTDGDLYKPFKGLLDSLQVRLQHIRSHSGNVFNDAADRYAKEGARQMDDHGVMVTGEKWNVPEKVRVRILIDNFNATLVDNSLKNEDVNNEELNDEDHNNNNIYDADQPQDGDDVDNNNVIVNNIDTVDETLNHVESRHILLCISKEHYVGKVVSSQVDAQENTTLLLTIQDQSGSHDFQLKFGDKDTPVLYNEQLSRIIA